MVSPFADVQGVMRHLGFRDPFDVEVGLGEFFDARGSEDGSILDVGDVIGDLLQIRDDVGGEEDGRPVLIRDFPEAVEQFVSAHGV